MKLGVAAPPADDVTAAAVAAAREKTEIVSDPWLLTSTSKLPLALATTSIVLGRAGVWPWANSTDATLKPLPAGAKILTPPLAKATTTWPPSSGLRCHDLLPGKNDTRAGGGVVQVEPHQVAAGCHVDSPRRFRPAKVGGWTTALPKLKSVCGLWSSKKPWPTPDSRVTVPLPPLKTARSGIAIAVQIANGHRDGPSPPDFRRGPGIPTQSPLGVVGAKDHRDVVAALVGDQHVGMPSPFKSATVTLAGRGADEIGLDRRGECWVLRS